ncbi:MAG: hypothetical protein AB7I27_04230 [Bacteriovoracaceae bacterium]
MRLLILLFIFSSISARAKDIVLLTSIKLSESLLLELEERFQNKFDENTYHLVIKHQAKPFDLYQVMTSDQTEALIWVSHSAQDHIISEGVKADEVIMDMWGNDVKRFFTLIPPHLRFVGIVGCEAKKIIDGFKARGNYTGSPDLEMMSFDQKVRLTPGFKKVLKRAAEVMRIPTQIENASLELATRIKVNHSSKSFSWIEMGDRVVGVINPEGSEATLSIPKDEVSKKGNLKHLRDKSSSGSLTILYNLYFERGSWELFQKKNGGPIGGDDKHLYLFKEKLSPKEVQ